MLTKIHRDLIAFLKAIGLDKETTLATDDLAETDENRLKLMRMMADRYQEKGKVTDEDVGKMLLFLIGERKKSSDTNSTRTEADTE